MMKILLSALVLCGGALAWNNGQGVKPPMGWNSEIAYGCNVNETIIQDTANFIVNQRLNSSGYVKLHNVTAGKIVRERQARISYKVCYLNKDVASAAFTIMQSALANDKMNIFYAIDNWQQNDRLDSNDQTWSLGMANSWRTSQFNGGSFQAIKQSFYSGISYTNGVGPQGWNDLGTLYVGANPDLTISEQQTHFALWCFAKSPLMLSLNFTAMAPETLSIVTNAPLIALNQDSLGQIAQCVQNCKISQGVEVFKVKAGDNGGYYALLLVNWDPVNEASIHIMFNCNITNMWFPSISTIANGFYQVNKIPPHGNAALKIDCKQRASMTQDSESFLE